jgi:hypothetical protein
MAENQNEVEHVRLEFRLPTWTGVPSIAGQLPLTVCGVCIRDLSTDGGRLGDFAMEYEGKNSLEHTHAVLTALLLSSDAGIKQTATFFEKGDYTSRREKHVESDYVPLWGHHGGQIRAEAIAFADQHSESIRDLQSSDSFSRIGNVLHFYRLGLQAPPDSAAVLFTTVLEAILGDATQELSFRLALAASHWVGGPVEERLSSFANIKHLYGQRSKIVHGSKLEKDLEGAAINLVDYSVPSLERLARDVLRLVFERELVHFFNTTKNLDEFFAVQSLGLNTARALEHVRYLRPKAQ